MNQTATYPASVTLYMTDLFEETAVEPRTICISNLRVADPSAAIDSECDMLAPADKQRAMLEEWIRDRGNEQHDTLLRLDSWIINRLPIAA